MSGFGTDAFYKLNHTSRNLFHHRQSSLMKQSQCFDKCNSKQKIVKKTPLLMSAFIGIR